MYRELIMKRIVIVSLLVLSLQAYAAREATTNTFKISTPSSWYFSGGIGFNYKNKGTKNARVRISALETDSLVQKKQQYFPLLNLSLKKSISSLGKLKQLRIDPSFHFGMV